MRINQVPPCGSGHNHSSRLHLLLLVPVLLIAGCGQSESGKPSGKESASQDASSPAVKKLSPEAARMDLAKLNKEFTQNTFVESAENGDKLAVELFLAAGMDVNAKYEHGNRLVDGITALMAACNKGHTAIVSVLIAKGADLTLRLEDGRTALLFACVSGHREVALLLLKQPAEARGYSIQSGSNPLIWAAKHGWPDVVALVLKKGDLSWINLEDAQNKSPLDYAKEGGHTEVVKLLEQAGQRLNGQAAAPSAANPQGAATDIGGNPTKGAPDAAFGRMMEEKWQQAERIAFRLSAVEPDEELLKSVRSSFAGEDIDAFRRRGCSDFQIAQLVLVVHEVIGKGAQAAFAFRDKEPTEADKKKMNMYKTLYDESWMAFEAAYLNSLKRGEAPVDFRFKNQHDQETLTALMWAAGKGRVELAKALVEKGANVSLKDDAGRTALYFATQNKQKDIEQLLLSKGAAPVQASEPPPSNSAPATSEPGQSQTGTPPTAESAQPARSRPRTMAQARQSMEKAEDDVAAYDAAFIAAIKKRWTEIRDKDASATEAKGKVSLSFRLWSNGRITDLAVTTNSAGDLRALLCQRAVLDGAPYPPWPAKMRQKVGEDSRKVQYDFSYDSN